MSEWEQIGERLRDRVAYSQGVKDTEERFIKLLEEHSEQKFADNFQRNDDLVHEDVCKLCEKFNGLGVAIALIKGGNTTDFTGSTLPISQEGENK